MDKGARYFRCDFQVHSPRDCNWKGHRPVTDEERGLYAARFVAACRERGLDAVAITDHHDIGFFPFIKAAAEAEADADGSPLPPHRRLVVFPGMELTLAVPCQAIILFDADIPVGALASMHTVLGVTQNDHAAPTHVQATRLDFDSLEKLAEMLDRLDHFRGRYIILPNVSEGGNSTLMRSNFAPKYCSMPCVGGYLDGAVQQLGKGNRRILDGNDERWGRKRLGLFQTSDNRSGDFKDLGTHSTWVKWATPTAEALRQACLACETRISQEPPVVPGMAITRLEVSDSKFLGPIDVWLNGQYSCLIGGRGTGKSTILEYLRWGLCDQPPTYADEDESAAYQEKRAALIEKTLRQCGGVVTVSFVLNSVPHAVRRSAQSGELSLKIGAGEFAPCAEADVRGLLPLQAYSQKQLSAVGTRTDELVRFIRTPIKAELDRLGADIEAQKAHVRGVFDSLVRKRKLQRELERSNLELTSLTLRVEALRQGLKGVSAADRDVLAQHDLFLREEQAIEQLGKQLGSVREMAADFRASLSGIPGSKAVDESLPNAELIRQVRVALGDVVSNAAAQIDAAIAALADDDPAVQAYARLVAGWKEAFERHDAHYARAKADASSQQGQLAQIEEAEGKIKALRAEVAETQGVIDQFGPVEQDFAEGRTHWVDLYKTRVSLMQTKCAELTTLSDQRIRANMRRGAGTGKVKDRLTALLSGTRIRTKKAEDLCALVSQAADPHALWGEALAELDTLVDYSGGGAEGTKPGPLPLLTKAGFTEADFEKLAPRLTPQEWAELALTELEDVPVFEYRQSPGQYIRFADASAGQQATALLRVLLNQAGPPLLIDQPEEDLDNQVILEVVQEIWKAKKKRQLIFSSHNPNLVVNGDADLVVCCDYRTAGDHSGGRVKCEGAIDVEEIKKEITLVMEGGRDAFRLRKEKYGF